ncbi:DUF6760 family protein [Amycolatopsis sp. NPDC049252]|uniref:DUF6760 family protein n=1 Tax=Amycolatopsis sp. NPDC049252 TaxID=3363933 RepID=UPI0037141FE1
MTYGLPRLWEEITYLAYYLHWPFGELADLDHRSRETVITEVGRINEQLNAGRQPPAPS